MSKGAHPSLGRRKLLRYAGASLIFSVSPLAGAATKLPSVLAVRIWPAADYTRVTLEHDAPLKYTHFTVENPDRLVVDIEGVELVWRARWRQMIHTSNYCALDVSSRVLFAWLWN